MEQESPCCLIKENLWSSIMFLICQLFNFMVNQLRSQLLSQGIGISNVEPCFYMCLRIGNFETSLALENGNMVQLLLIDEALFLSLTVICLFCTMVKLIL